MVSLDNLEHFFNCLPIRYLDNRVFVSLANGDICVYLRDGGMYISIRNLWTLITIGFPFSHLLEYLLFALPVHRHGHQSGEQALECQRTTLVFHSGHYKSFGCGDLNGKELYYTQYYKELLKSDYFPQVIHQIQISSDSKPITNMTVSNNHVWISIQNSAHIKCFHSNTWVGV